jgi:hypothetical protein
MQGVVEAQRLMPSAVTFVGSILMEGTCSV